MVKFARQNSSDRSHFKTQIVIASAVACLAYMISGLTYDTNVSFTPVFGVCSVSVLQEFLICHNLIPFLIKINKKFPF